MPSKYQMPVSEFIRESRAGNINYPDFYSRLFEKVKETDKKHNLFITLSEKEAKNDANSVKKGVLSGLPISVKDNICTKGIRTTAGSKILDNYIPPFDATCIEKTKKEGGIIIGKTAQDEFGFGTFSVNCAYAVPKNPLDPSRSCGGSSGGAAGITAALDMPHIALAESTGGSISCPASFCGVAGLTPTYGRVSRQGLIDYASSLDKIGIMAKKTSDIALMLGIIAGKDRREATSIDAPVPKYTKAGADIKGMKIGIPKEYFSGDIDEKIKKQVLDAISKLEELGAKTGECSLPNTEYAVSAYYIIAMAEASTNLAKFCGQRYGACESLEGDFNQYFSRVRGKYFGEEAKRRVLLGTYARMAGYRDQYYLRAMKVRRLIIDDYKRAFKKFDVLAAPTMPFVAPKFTEIEKLKPVDHYNADILTVPANLAGIPMLSVPCGKKDGMPVGIHLMGDHLGEEDVLRAGMAIERL